MFAWIAEQQQNREVKEQLTIGLDLGDRGRCWCALDSSGEVLGHGQVVTEKQPLEVLFRRIPASVVALEVGTHSAWVSRVFEGLGHAVIVANARQVKVISESNRAGLGRGASS